LLYLDHAATSFPKPEPVLAAVQRWYRELGVSAERGSGRRTAVVAASVQAARAGLGALAGTPPDRIAFTSGATEAINLFLRGFLRAGDRVLTTVMEHSSVVRPLLALQRERNLELRMLELDPDGGLGIDAAAVREALWTFRPRLFAFTHASNVTGAVVDAAAFCELAAAAGCTTLVDASQTAGAIDLRLQADAIAASCHKSLLGPPGLGFLAVREGVPVTSQKQGGTGSSRALAEHPASWPQAFEAGTPNTPAILGLEAALAVLRQRDAQQTLAHGLALVDELAELLHRDNRYCVLQPAGKRLPVLSFVHAAMDPAEIGLLLDAADIHVRTGFHCAPWIHERLGTGSSGTVRVSPGSLITAADIRAAAAILAFP
jgi:cysteine desulfurase / selenocysteine lyase